MVNSPGCAPVQSGKLEATRLACRFESCSRNQRLNQRKDEPMELQQAQLVNRITKAVTPYLKPLCGSAVVDDITDALEEPVMSHKPELPADQQLLVDASSRLVLLGGDMLDALDVGGEEGNEIIETAIDSLRELADDLEKMMEEE